MKHELSILIPVYNEVCTGIVKILQKQCQAIVQADSTFKYEIIVVDDHSPHTECCQANEAINLLENCRFIAKEKNSGSAATRNFLAAQSQYEWLLFLDCDMQVTASDFIRKYLEIETTNEGLINGGIAIANYAPHNLRYLYEKKCEAKHTAQNRQQRPYQSFRSTNFLIRREVMLACPFDERFKKSGYEDVMLGKQLKKQGVLIKHIDNPTTMVDFEENADYMAKTDRNLTTLYEFRQEFRGYSGFITFADNIHIAPVKWAIRLWHSLFGKLERKLLCSRHPSLMVFNLYRLGFFISLGR